MLQKLIQNFGTINTSDKPFEKDWCISPMPGKIQQVRLTLNNNKSYDYACRYGVEEGAAAIVGYSLPYYDYDPDDVLGGASTGCFGIVSQVLPTLKIKRSYAVEVDYVFIPSTNKRAITQCVKYLQFGPDDYEKTLQFGKHTATIRPITYFTRQILAAASVLAHPKLAKPDDLELAKNRIILKKAIDTEMQELEHSPSGDIGMDFSDIQTPDPEIDKVFDLFLPANKAQYDFKEGLLSNGSELFPLVVFSDECIKHISKYPHIAAVSIMIRGGFKNLLEAYLSADPPIGEFYDEMCQKLDGIGYPEVYEVLKAYQPTSAPTPAGESTSEAFLLSGR